MRITLLLLLLVATIANAEPVIFDTDIGTDVDDAYALVGIDPATGTRAAGSHHGFERCGGTRAARGQTVERRRRQVG